MKTYCVKCKKNTENVGSTIFKKKNGRLIMQSNVLNVELKSQDL